MMRLCLLLLLPLSSLALAAEEAPLSALVQKQLLEPLHQKDLARSRFSRAKLPPIGRTVRVIDAEARQDEKGGRFVTFAVDEQRGDTTREAMTGCAYLDAREVFVKKGDALFPAALLLGKKVAEADAWRCRPAEVAQVR